MRKYTLILAAALALAMFAVSPALFADTYTDPATDVQFTGTVSPTLVTLTVQCLNASTCGSIYLGDVTLKGFSWTGTPLGSAPGGYTLEIGGMNLDALGSGGGCDGSDLGSALCWDNPTPTNLSLKLGTSPLVFTASISGGTFTDGGTLHVQASGFNTTAGTQTRGNKPLAVSQDLSGSTTVPEPSTLALLAAGMIGFAVLGRKVLA